MIILDTNVVSELMKPAPAASVVRWVAAQPASGLYTTSITQAQLVDWAEDALMEGEFAEEDAAAISAVVARVGIADVRAFGLNV